MTPDPDRLILVGRVGRTHGVRGEMKVVPETDDPQRFADLDRLFIGTSAAEARPVQVDGVRFQYPKGRTVVLLSLAGVESLEAAEGLRNEQLFANPDDLPALADGEAYLHDLIGFEVVRLDDAGEPADVLGTIRDFYEGAQLLIAVARPDGGDVLLPDVDEFVVRLDLDARRFYVRPPEGLFDDA